MLTRKPVSPTRNKVCPMGWAAGQLLNIDEGAGAILTNLSDIRTGTASDFDMGMSGVPGWATDADEGPYVNMPAGCKANLTNSSGSDWIYPRGTIVMRFRLNDLASGQKAVWGTGRAPNSLTNLYEANVKFDPATNQYYLTYSYPGTVKVLYVDKTLSTSETVTVIVSWGERGIGLWVDGEASPDNAADVTTHLQVTDTKIMCFGGVLTGYANMRAYGFAWFDWQLTEVERALVFADPHLQARPYAAANYLHDRINPWACCPTPTGVSWRFPVLDSAPDYNFYVRVNYGTDKTLATKSTTASHQLTINDVNAGWFEISATGLTPNTRHYWIAEWSTDGSTWYPFPGGQGTFFPQRTNEAPFTYAKTADGHQGIQATIPYGLDVVRAGGTYAQVRDWRIAQDIFERRESYDFIMSMGDESYGNRTADGGWCQLANLLKISGCVFSIVGNHENLAGWFLAKTDAEDAITKDKRSKCWRAWMRNSANPHKDTYDEGVPWSTLPTAPVDDLTDYVSNVPWLPDVPAGGGAWAPEGITGPQDFFDTYVYVDPLAGTHIAKMRGLHDPHTNFAFTWGAGKYKTLVIGVDIYSCSVPGSLGHNDLRTSPNEASLSDETWAWLEMIVASSDVRHIDINMHSFPDAGLQTGTVWGGSNYYWRGSGLHVTGTEALRLLAFCNQHSAMLSLAHDHVFSAVKRQDIHVVHCPASGGTNMFGTNDATQAQEEYGNRNRQGGDLPGLISKWGVWGYATFAPQGSFRFAIGVRQAAVDSQSWTDQDSSILNLKGRYIGEELTVAGLAVTLSEIPLDILCMCDSADGTFPLTGDPHIVSDYATYDDYSHSIDAGDGMPIDADFLHALASAVLDVSGAYADGSKIRVHYAPRTVCELGLRNGGKAEDWSSFGAAPNAYGRNTLVI